MAYLKIENFKKSFGLTEALKGVSFDLDKGEVLSIIGSSGCGKTTLLRCINFLETPDEGKMTLDGILLTDEPSSEKCTEEALRQKRLNFGLVFQSFNLFPQYDVIKNVTLAPLLMHNEKVKAFKKSLKMQKNGLKSAELRQKVKEFDENGKKMILQEGEDLLNKIGLTEKTHSYPHQLSGGQKQRVAIARALALKPKILCFDEPTSALDPELTGEVLKVIGELKKNSQVTMIIVTHEMEFAKNISDKVIYMSNGQIIESGTPEKVFLNPENQLTKQFLQGYNNKNV